MLAGLKNIVTFDSILTDQRAGSEMAQFNRGFFYCPLQYDGGLIFVPGNGRPCARICQSGNGHRFLLATDEKLRKMKNNSLVVSTKNPLSELIAPDNLKKECKHLAMLLDSYSFNCADKSIILEVYEAYVALENLIEKIKTNERKAA